MVKIQNQNQMKKSFQNRNYGTQIKRLSLSTNYARNTDTISRDTHCEDSISRDRNIYSDYDSSKNIKYVQHIEPLSENKNLYSSFKINEIKLYQPLLYGHKAIYNEYKKIVLQFKCELGNELCTLLLVYNFFIPTILLRILYKHDSSLINFLSDKVLFNLNSSLYHNSFIYILDIECDNFDLINSDNVQNVFNVNSNNKFQKMLNKMNQFIFKFYLLSIEYMNTKTTTLEHIKMDIIPLYNDINSLHPKILF